MAVQHLQLETEAVEKQCRARLVDDETEASQGAHGAVAKATGREAPAQGSNPGCGTLKLQGSPLGYLFQKKNHNC